MLYELFAKLLGLGIVSTLWFHPLQVTLHHQGVEVQAILNQPVTPEMQQLLKSGMPIALVYQVTLLIDSDDVKREILIKDLTYREGSFYVDGQAISSRALQRESGEIRTQFEVSALGRPVKLQFLVEADIRPNANFEEATKLKTMSLWNYHKPTKRAIYVWDRHGLELMRDH